MRTGKIAPSNDSGSPRIVADPLGGNLGGVWDAARSWELALGARAHTVPGIWAGDVSLVTPLV